MEFGHLRFRSNFREGPFPSFEEGALRPINQMSRYRKEGAAGEVGLDSCTVRSDLPGRADSKVARHLLDRRSRPSSKEGQREQSAVIDRRYS
jgi:hypothetical protein